MNPESLMRNPESFGSNVHFPVNYGEPEDVDVLFDETSLFTEDAIENSSPSMTYAWRNVLNVILKHMLLHKMSIGELNLHQVRRILGLVNKTYNQLRDNWWMDFRLFTLFSLFSYVFQSNNIPVNPDNTTRTEESFFAIYDPLADILRFEAQINNREQAMNDDPYPIYYRFGDIGDQPYEYNQETATFIINDIYTELPTVIE